MSDMEPKLKHLELIQAVINRMAGNSFLLKGWTVTLVAALFALAADDGSAAFIWLAVFPGIVFWALDGFFLHQERLYRRLYDQVRQITPDAIDFSMDTQALRAQVPGWLPTCLSLTLGLFYGAIGGAVLLVAWLL